jgi:hypothetical protein
MKIVLEQEGGHLAMSVVMMVSDTIEWETAIKDMSAELDHRQGVRRMSYDTWHWDLRRKQEAEEYITYFYLKHE